MILREVGIICCLWISLPKSFWLMKSTELPRTRDEGRHLSRKLFLLVAYFFFPQTGTNPIEKVPCGPQGSAATYFCSGLKHALSLTLSLDYAPPCAWRATASLIRLSCCLMVNVQTLRYSLIQSTVDSNWLPWFPTILQG